MNQKNERTKMIIVGVLGVIGLLCLTAVACVWLYSSKVSKATGFIAGLGNALTQELSPQPRLTEFEKQVLALNPKASPEKLKESRDLEARLHTAERKVAKIDPNLPPEEFEEVALLDEKVERKFQKYSSFEDPDMAIREAFRKLGTHFGASARTKEQVEKFRQKRTPMPGALTLSGKRYNAVHEEKMDLIDERYIGPAIRRMNSEVRAPYSQKWIDRCVMDYYERRAKEFEEFGNNLEEETVRRAKEIRG